MITNQRGEFETVPVKVLHKSKTRMAMLSVSEKDYFMVNNKSFENAFPITLVSSKWGWKLTADIKKDDKDKKIGYTLTLDGRNFYDY